MRAARRGFLFQAWSGLFVDISGGRLLISRALVKLATERLSSFVAVIAAFRRRCFSPVVEVFHAFARWRFYF